MEVRDLWPESVKSVGAVKNDLPLTYFTLLEKRLYKSAKSIVTLTDTFKLRISSRGIDPSKIYVVKNGANLELFTPRDKNQALLRELKLEGKFLAGFIGTIGMAHKLDFIVESAMKINDPDIFFLFIGAGAEKQNLEALVKKLKPSNVAIYDLIPKEKVPDYLSILDISLIIILRKVKHSKRLSHPRSSNHQPWKSPFCLALMVKPASLWRNMMLAFILNRKTNQISFQNF
jgi:glycosyltransferase involved in cell wall biosynthesis